MNPLLPLDQPSAAGASSGSRGNEPELENADRLFELGELAYAQARQRGASEEVAILAAEEAEQSLLRSMRNR